MTNRMDVWVLIVAIALPVLCVAVLVLWHLAAYLSGKLIKKRKVYRHALEPRPTLQQTRPVSRTQAVTGTALVPFVPAGANFAGALDFFAALGFDKQWQQDGLAGLRFGGATFMLQDINVPEWQKNQMITLEVTDLDAYWAELEAKALPSRFPGVSLRPPTQFPWGRELHIIDLAGVCWHVRQARRE
jgi:hypothetical protein